MVSLAQAVESIRGDVLEFRGNPNFSIVKPAPLNEAKADEISFCGKSGAEALEMIGRTASKAIVVSNEMREAMIPRGDLNLIFAKNPRLAFMRIVSRNFPPMRPQGIHPSAFVHPNARIHETAYIGPMSYIGDSTVGENSVLWGSVHVYDNVLIGRNVTIHAGAILGADGFGYERNEHGVMEKFPHIGGVRVENDVEIGANTCIDRGTLGNTCLKRGCKIDNLVHIAHNVVVGEDAVVIALSMVGGSTKIGNRSWIAPSAVLRDQLRIGDDSVVGLGSVLTKDVSSGVTVLGSPARPLGEQMELMKAMKRLLHSSET